MGDERLARQKRVQAGLSLGAASLGLSALATKGVGTAIRKAPRHAAKLRLTPKHADKADAASLGLVTTGAGVGGFSGINFADLERREAQKEHPVSKSAFGVIEKYEDSETKHERAALVQQKILGQRAYKEALAAGRFIPEGQDRDYRPAVQQKAKPAFVPKRLPKSGGIDPESRRQKRMKAEQYGAAGGAVALGGAAAHQGMGAAVDAKTAMAFKRRADRLDNKARPHEARSKTLLRGAGVHQNQANIALARLKPAQNYKGAAAQWRQRYIRQQVSPPQQVATSMKRTAGREGRSGVGYHKAAVRSATQGKLASQLARTRGKRALALGAGAAGLAAASGGMAYMKRRQGKEYTDWWDA